MIKLSICIPTYNRAAFIGETLKSIISQSPNHQIEIVVSDNDSTDDTEIVVREFQKQFQQINYFKWNENQGADKNYLKVVELAKGEYCWLMGSDDVLIKDSILYILKELESQHDIYLCNRTECDFNLVPFRDGNWLSIPDDRVFDFYNSNHLSEYLDLAQSIGALFSYLSAIIVKRELWIAADFDNEYIGSAYSHTYKMMKIVVNGSKLKYIHTPLVLCRMGNDSFQTEGLAKRFLLDLYGYSHLSSLIADQNLQLKFLKVMNKTCGWHFLARLKAFSPKNQWIDVKKQLKLFQFPFWKIMLAEGIGSISPLVLIIAWAQSKFTKYQIKYKSKAEA